MSYITVTYCFKAHILSMFWQKAQMGDTNQAVYIFFSCLSGSWATDPILQTIEEKISGGFMKWRNILLIKWRGILWKPKAILKLINYGKISAFHALTCTYRQRLNRIYCKWKCISDVPNMRQMKVKHSSHIMVLIV